MQQFTPQKPTNQEAGMKSSSPSAGTHPPANPEVSRTLQQQEKESGIKASYSGVGCGHLAC